MSPNIISNSLSFILIKKPEIISYEPKILFPVMQNNSENTFVKIIFENPILNDLEYLFINHIYNM